VKEGLGVKTFIRLFLVLLFSFSAVTIFFYLFQFGLSKELLFWIWDDLLLAALISIVITFIHLIFIIRSPYRKDFKGAIQPVQTRKIEVSMSYNDTMRLCISSLEMIKNSRVREVSYSEGKIVSVVSANWKNLGQIISFGIQELDKDRTCVELLSKPAYYALKVDFGKNLENVERIVAFFREKVAIKTA
jgi:hypothetical protein